MNQTGFQRLYRAMVMAPIFMIAFASSAVAACCSLNGGPCNIIPPLVHGVSPWTGSVCGSTISGTSCDAELSGDVNASSGDCLTLGSGVTLDMKGATLNCTSGGCGKAIINTSSGGSSNKVVIQNGVITGCWSRGVSVEGGTNSSATQMYVDLAGSGCQGDVGLYGLRAGADHVVLKHADICYYWGGGDLQHSVIRDCDLGAKDLYTTASITNVQFLNNDVHVNTHDAGTDTIDTHSSSFQYAGTCTCIDRFSACVTPIEDCLDISASGNESFVDDAILP
jgi:hypothetical protein